MISLTDEEVKFYENQKQCNICGKGIIYHGKLKKTKYISSFHELFDSKKDRISCHRKV